MNVVKLKPAIKNYVWGGHKLKEVGKQCDFDKISECWELSFHKDGPTIVDSGIYKNKNLCDVVTKSDLGNNLLNFEFFPCLIKLIDSGDNLSVQVHPSDEYALKNENSYGKTEMWYILDAEEGAGIYLGFKEDETIDDVKNALEDGTILNKLNFFQVKKGESYFIESGTIHAIGKGVTLIEIQQNSNLTYRLYDYNRVGNDGKPRELHIEKALKVVNLNKYIKKYFPDNIIGECKYFCSSRIDFDENYILKADDKSFISITFIEGKGMVNDMVFNKFDSFFIPANKVAKITGKGSFILTKVN